MRRRSMAVVAIVAFILAASGVLTLVWLAYRTTRRAAELSQRVALTHQVISTLDEVLALVEIAETKQRGFIITGQTSYADDSAETGPAILVTMTRLESLVRDSPVQTQRASDLRAAVLSKLTDIDTLLRVRRAEGFEIARDQLASGFGRDSMNRMRLVIETMKREEMQQLSARQESSEAAANRTARFATVGAVSDVVMLAAILTLVLVQLQRSRRLSAAVKRAHDEAMQTAEARSQFLSNMSHEIRTPLNAITGFTGLLLEESLGARERELAENVHDSTEVLLEIVNEVLDFSSIDRGEIVIEPVDFHLRDMVDSTLQMLATSAYRKRLEIGVLWDAELPEFVQGDAGRIRQVLTNLVSNAIKFTERGEVIVSLHREAADFVRFSVTDTGRGIDPEARQRLFKPFTQFGPSIPSAPGTGLGLAICAHLVELLGGSIGADSVPAKGSTFWFSIPLPRPAAEAAEVRRTDHAAFENLRALVVDDAEASRRTIAQSLSSWKMKTEEATESQDALEKLRQAKAAGRPYDFAAIDSSMPQMDGMVLSRLIKSDPALRSTRIILVTSVLDRIDRATLASIGIEGTVTKPVRESALHDAIASAIPAGGAAAAQKKVTKVRRKRSDVRVLVVEDSRINQRLVILQLESLGFPADAAANGAESLEAMARIHYDLVFMDCQMPVLDGFAATREIRRREAGARHVTVIALTANALGGERERCIAAGMDDYTSKPVRLRELERLLDQWLPDKGEDPLDRATVASLRKLAANDSSLMVDVVSLYVRDSTDRIGEIESAIRNSNASALFEAAHALKSTSGSIGASQVGALAAQLERLGRDGAISGAATLLDRLRSEQENAVSWLKKLIPADAQLSV